MITMDKNNDAIVIHFPTDKRLQFESLAEHRGLTKSQYGRFLIDCDLEKHRLEFEFMKSIFESN